MPNVLCFVGDQLRFDAFSCTGHPAVRTPHVDRLAAAGVRFERCYTVQPMCMATRSTWLTGLTPRGHHVRCNGIPLDSRLPTMTEALRRTGFHTHSIGKIHANPWMPHDRFGLDELDPAEWPEAIQLWDADRITDLPVPYYGFESVDLLCGWTSGDYGRWLRRHEPNFRELVSPGTARKYMDRPETVFECRLPKELHYSYWASECSGGFLREVRASGRPFFLWCSIPDPHPPYSVSEPYFSMYRPADMPTPTRREGELADLPPHYRRVFAEDFLSAGRFGKTDVCESVEREVAAVTCGIVTQWDDMVGRIMAQLEQFGFMDDTIVVVMSDHGQMLGDHWMRGMPPSHLDGTIRVPSIWRFPAEFGRGVVSPALVSHLDFAPTILDLLGTPIPEGRIPPEPECAAQRPAWPGRSMAPLLRGDVDSIQDSVIAENDADYLGLRQRTLITRDWHLTCYIGESYGELFDLRHDPGQLFNLWDKLECADTKRDLQVLLMERFAATDSTLPRRMGHA